MKYINADHQFIKRYINKGIAIRLKGGKCLRCDEKRIQCLEFHHIDDKNFEIGNRIRTNPLNYIDELNKCIILCSNCHKEEHFIPPNTIFLKYKKIAIQNKICECGFSNIHHLQHHHLSDKKYELNELLRSMHNNYEINEFNDFPNYVKNELNKCIVVCPNCHLDIHFDKERYQKFIDTINAGIDGKERIFKTALIPLSIQKEVLISAKNGNSFKDIIEKFNLNKTTVSKIIRNLDPDFYNNRKKVCANHKNQKKTITQEVRFKILEMSRIHKITKLSRLLNISRYIIERTLLEEKLKY